MQDRGDEGGVPYSQLVEHIVALEQLLERSGQGSRPELAEQLRALRQTAAQLSCTTSPDYAQHCFGRAVQHVSSYACLSISLGGLIITWNRGAELLFGYGAADMLGQPLSSLFPPEDQATRVPDQLLTTARERGTVVLQRWQMGSGGTLFWAEGVLYPAFTDGGQHHGYLMIIADRTQQKHQGELREHLIRELSTKQNYLESTLAQMPSGMILAEAPSGRIVLHNAEAAKLLGHAIPNIDNYRGYTAFGGVHADGRSYAPDEYPIARALLHGETIYQEEMLYRRSEEEDTIFIINAAPVRDAEGRIIAAIGTFHDITDRKRQEHEIAALYEAERDARKEAEQAREQAEAAVERLERLQHVTAALSEAQTAQEVITIAVEHGIRATRAYAGSTLLLSQDGSRLELVGSVGYPAHFLERWQHIAITPEAPRTPVIVAVQEAQPVWLGSRAEWEAQFPEIPISESTRAGASLPLIVRGIVIGALALSFDTEQRFDPAEQDLMLALAQQCAQALERARLYEAERHAREVAEQAMRARDQFLSVAAHELKTPVTALLGYTQLLARRFTRDGLLSERDQRGFDHLLSQARRLHELTNVLLDFSRLQRNVLRVDMRPVDLGYLLDQLIEGLRPALHNHTLLFQEPEQPVIVEGDALRLQQIFSNLLENAAKYSPEGGPIELLLAHVPAEQIVEVSVVDRGIGIPPEALSNLFVPFFRAENAHKHGINGSGLGLAVVRELISAHQGAIRVESSEGEGSTFIVVLPTIDSHVS